MERRGGGGWGWGAQAHACMCDWAWIKLVLIFLNTYNKKYNNQLNVKIKKTPFCKYKDPNISFNMEKSTVYYLN